MRKILTVILICLAGMAQAQGTWTQVDSFPGIGREHPFMFVIGRNGYVGSGGTDTNALNDLWAYNADSNTWTQKANFPGMPRLASIGFSIGNKGYAGTGCDFSQGIEYSDFYEYNPDSNIWNQKADFGGGTRAWTAGFSIGDKGYIGCGFHNQWPALADFWEYNPSTNAWTIKDSLQGPARILAVGFSIVDKGYIAIGRGNNSDLSDCWEYNPITDTWNQKASFPPGTRVDVAAFSICEKGFLGIGGEAPWYTDFWEFDPTFNQWTQKATFPGHARDDGTFFAIGTFGYIGLGQYDNNINYVDFFQYTPDIVPCPTPSGIKAIPSSHNLIIILSPNPFQDKTLLTIQGTTTNASLNIYNTEGKVVYKMTGISGTNKQITIDKNQLSGGIYFYQLMDANGVLATGKLVKSE
jgi:N-acetylneuraminic acid mutarotase